MSARAHNRPQNVDYVNKEPWGRWRNIAVSKLVRHGEQWCIKVDEVIEEKKIFPSLLLLLRIKKPLTRGRVFVGKDLRWWEVFQGPQGEVGELLPVPRHMAEYFIAQVPAEPEQEVGSKRVRSPAHLRLAHSASKKRC